MSQKETCPSCTSHTSAIRSAFQNGEPCPSCGLSAGAASEIMRIRRRIADDDLKQRLEEMIKETALWEQRALRAEDTIDRVVGALEPGDGDR